MTLAEIIVVTLCWRLYLQKQVAFPVKDCDNDTFLAHFNDIQHPHTLGRPVTEQTAKFHLDERISASPQPPERS